MTSPAVLQGTSYGTRDSQTKMEEGELISVVVNRWHGAKAYADDLNTGKPNEMECGQRPQKRKLSHLPNCTTLVLKKRHLTPEQTGKLTLRLAREEQPISPQLHAKYSIRRKLGEGTYGVVYKCQNRVTGELVAIKRISSCDPNGDIPTTSLREISLLQSIDHQNIIRLKDIVATKKFFFLAMEVLETDLGQYLKSTRFNRRDVKILMLQMLKGVAYLHDQEIYHRDLKPGNVLLDTNRKVAKLADFGLARAFNLGCQNYTSEVVTLFYRAPELLLGAKDYHWGVDIWSLGCVFFEMVTRDPLFTGQSEVEQLQRIVDILGAYPKDLWQGRWLGFWNKPCRLEKVLKGHNLDPDLVDLLDRMLRYHPDDRIRARQALQHKFFAECG